MKVAVLGDLHRGSPDPNKPAEQWLQSWERAYRNVLKGLVQSQPDVILIAGDYGMLHNQEGEIVSPATNIDACLHLLRNEFPDRLIFSVLGNHDFETGESTALAWQESLSRIRSVFEQRKVIFLDDRMPMVIDKIAFAGCSGWTHLPHAMGSQYFPDVIGGCPYGLYMWQRASDKWEQDRKWLERNQDQFQKVVFTSHFPVSDSHRWHWDPTIGHELRSKYDAWLVEGHIHSRHSAGPKVWNSGSDYGRPAFRIFEV